MLIRLYERLFRKEDIETQEKKLKLFRETEEQIARNYIKEKIENVSFSFSYEKNSYENAIELMEKGIFEGRDNEVTTFLTPLFDDANLIRGQIELWKTEPYPHDWIEVNIGGFAYCFDPCFNGICIRSEYNKIFNPTSKAKIHSTAVKKQLLDYLSYQTSKGAVISGKNDITDPFYKIFANVKGEVDNDKIKKLQIQFYE